MASTASLEEFYAEEKSVKSTSKSHKHKKSSKKERKSRHSPNSNSSDDEQQQYTNKKNNNHNNSSINNNTKPHIPDIYGTDSSSFHSSSSTIDYPSNNNNNNNNNNHNNTGYNAISYNSIDPSPVQQNNYSFSNDNYNNNNTNNNHYSSSYKSKFSSFSSYSDNRETVQKWLSENDFDVEVQNKLKNFTVSDLFQLSKQDIKDLIGKVDGIRLANRIKLLQEKLNNLSINNNSNNNHNNNNSSFHNEYKSNSPPKPGRYGFCSYPGCRSGAICNCDGENCNRSLCTLHGHKQLISGCILCTHCQSLTTEGKFLSYVGMTGSDTMTNGSVYVTPGTSDAGCIMM